MALKDYTLAIGNLQDDNDGNNYAVRKAVYILKQNKTIAPIFKDGNGLTPITQDGVNNVTDEFGEFTFWVEIGDYIARVGGKDRSISVGTAQALVAQHNNDPLAHPELSEFITQEANRAEMEADRAESSAEQAMTAGWIYSTVADGEAARVDDDYFWVVSSESVYVLELWQMGVTNATDTGKRTVAKGYIDTEVQDSKNVTRNISTNSEITLAQVNTVENYFDVENLTLVTTTVGSSPSNIVYDRSVGGGLDVESLNQSGFRGISSAHNLIPVGTDITASIENITGSSKVAGFSVGDDSSRIWVGWGSSGGLVSYDNDYNIIEVLLPSAPERAYSDGDNIKINIKRKSESSFEINLIVNNVNVSSADLSSTSESGFSVAFRGLFTCELKELVWIGEAQNKLDSISSEPVIFESFSVLPNYPEVRENLGFTCTGLDRFSRGKWAGCWAVGDDGRIKEGDSSPFNPSVHIMDNDFRQILLTIPMPYNHSVQGVAIDTSGNKDTIWVATSGDGRVRQFDEDGAEITTDTIVLSTIGMVGSSNALSYDADNNALWLGNATNEDLWLVSCDSTASPRVLEQIVLNQRADHCVYLASKNAIYYQPSGRDAIDDYIIKHDLATGTETTEYQLQFGQSVEGFHIDELAKKLTCVSDAGYHFNNTSPALNTANVYKIKI